jgi:hypothetical protein
MFANAWFMPRHLLPKKEADRSLATVRQREVTDAD